MKWNEDHSLMLSRCCVIFFALVLLVVDASCWKVFPIWFDAEYFRQYELPSILMVYAYSIPAWIALANLWKLLSALQKGSVFTADNIRLLRIISWCCFAVAGISLISVFCLSTLMSVLLVASGLMGLIVRIVKNIFEQAAAMKDELDLTV